MSAAQGALSPASAAGVYTQPQGTPQPVVESESPPPKAPLVPKDDMQGSASDVSRGRGGGKGERSPSRAHSTYYPRA